ncbi:MAG: response regulator [Pedobacter sp.]|nr:MAG: response regulator [Pedobacter sp.]
MSKILVLDNDLGNADVIQLVLEEQNHQVKNINQADLLNDSIENFKPDLIVMDIILDVADGRDLCNLVKRNHDTGHIPIMLITALLESQVDDISCKADGIIFKPFDYNKLTRMVDRLIVPRRDAPN